MSEQEIIKVVDVVGSEFCISSEEGEKVYEKVANALRNKRNVQLSFEKVEDLTSAFLNAAIGQLYGEFSEDDVRKYLSIANLAREDFGLLKRVIDRAKDYFKNPDMFIMTLKEELGGVGDE